MSLYLAPVHFWLFNKIKLSESLERDLEESLTNKFGNEVYSIFCNSLKEFGSFTENKPLDEIIDTSNIHGWLQDKVSKTELRTAYLLTNVINEFGEEALKTALDVYKKQGYICGNELKENNENQNALVLFKGLNNYILDGMPCDNANSILMKNDDLVEWENKKCIHKPYWDKVSGDITYFYNLRDQWIESFIATANNNFHYEKHDTLKYKICKL